MPDAKTPRTSVFVALLVAASGCAKPAVPPAPAPIPNEAPPAAAATPAVRGVAGTYRLRADVARGNRGNTSGRRRAPPNRETTLLLGAGAARNPDDMAGVAAQYAATVSIPGYANPGQGRRGGGSTASWWPLAGDSVVIRVVGQRGNRLELRGAVRGTEISGDVWVLSIETGNTFQLGTFTAVKSR